MGSFLPLRRFNLRFVVFIVAASLLVSTAAVAKPKTDHPHRANEVIIKFKPGATTAEQQAILSDLGALQVKGLGIPRAKHAKIVRMNVDQAIEKYSGSPKVEYIEPNYIVQISRVPNDSLFSLLWGMSNLGQTGGTPGDDIHATSAWDVTTGSASVLVAVIDTGVDYNHFDLASNIYVNPLEANGLPGVDDDSNGFVDDVHGWDFANDDSDPMDDNGHGTHCSGTIGAVGDNLAGVAGVNWNVRILPCKFLSASGSGTTTDAIDAIYYAALMHVRVMSNSWGGGGYSQALLDAIQAANDSGIVFVAAAGNAGADNDVVPNYPSNYDVPCVIAVAATDHNDQLAGFSSYGAATVDLGAPGVDIFSTFPGNSFGYSSGTSMATPHVAGAAALVISRFPGINALGVKNLLMDRSDPIASLAGRTVSGGRLNVFMPIADPDSVPPDSVLDLSLVEVQGSRVRLSWTAPGDDGTTGRASFYELRYSTFPITASNFGSNPLATAVPSPGLPGTLEVADVTGLGYATRYYFAVKAFDEFANGGGLSNLVSALTLDGPNIVVSPLSISETLLNGQTADHVLTISNTGVSELHFDISSAGAAATAPHVVRTFTPRPHEDQPRYSELPAFRTGPYATRRASRSVTEETVPVRGTSPHAGALRVLIVESNADVSDIVAQLQLFPEIARVDVFHASTSTPTPADLAPYDVVMLSNGAAFGDGNALGDVLADYADTGGGVILTVPSTISGYHVGGRFLAGGYSPFELGYGPAGFSTLGTFDSAHPIMAGIGSISGDVLGVNTLSAGAQWVANWTTGQPFVATKGSNVVAVNVFLAVTGYWSGDLPALLRNAIVWSSHTAGFVQALPDSGVVQAGGSVGVVVRFDAGGLDGGTYDAVLNVHSDDPDQPVVPVGAHLTVIGAPNLLLHGESVVRSSSQEYSSSGATTIHHLFSTTPSSGGGRIDLLLEGDYGFSPEVATLVVEGAVIGQTLPMGADCLSGLTSFPISASQLAGFLADGRIDCEVVNDTQVDAFCVPNRHTVTLHYDAPATALAFGSLFLGLHKDITVSIENGGTEVLHVTSIGTGSAQFVADATSLTIAPRATLPLTIRFSPVAAAPYSATLHLESDDPDAPVFDIPLDGAGIEPPIAGVDPSSVALTLNEGESADRTLHVANTGASPLEVTIEVRPTVAPNAVVSKFSGLERTVGAPSNNAAAAASVRNQIERAGEPNYRTQSGEFESRASSPVPLTCVVEDPTANHLYGQANFGIGFYRYSPAANAWEPLASAVVQAGNNGGAAYLNGKVVTVYAENTSMGVYDIATNSWTLRANPLGAGTCDIASDGAQYLYLGVGSTFGRYDPVAATFTPLASPPFGLEPWGGMRHRAGVLFAHQGNGAQGFARYDIASDQWTLLPSVPGGAVAGSAIDPGTAEYFAYGSYGGQNLYKYSIDHGTWSVLTIPAFGVGDGGMGWLTGPTGIYFVQGEGGTGFARLANAPGYLTAAPETTVVAPGATADIGLHFDSTGLLGGLYLADVVVSSNDPVNPEIVVPTSLTVIGVPDIGVLGQEVALISDQTFVGTGVATTHRLDVTTPPSGGGRIDLIAEGDFGDFNESATLVVEGVPLGTVGATGIDCFPGTASFTLSPADLAAFTSDGRVDAQVVNSLDVNDFCSVNRHVVMLRYSNPSDSLRFGSRFVGLDREIIVSVQNRGSAPLVISSIASNAPAFVPSPLAVTIAPRQAVALRVRFTPLAAGSFTGRLRIQSDDPDTPQIDIGLSGQGVLPPVVDTTPDSLSATLHEGEGTTQTLRIENHGASPLEFALDILPRVAAAVRSPFRGLETAGSAVSNNAPSPSRPVTDAAASATSAEPRYHALAGDFESLASSPEPLTCVVEDASAGHLYAQGNFSNSFFRYDPVANAWQSRSSSPIYSGNNGGAALLNGRIYTGYTSVYGQLGVYDIASDTWTILSAPTGGTGLLASDGTGFLYVLSGTSLMRYEAGSGLWTPRSSPPVSFTPWGGMRHSQGSLFAHVGNSSDGFLSYDIATDRWTTLAPVPAGAVLGAAFDPLLNEYVCYGGYGGNNLYRYSVADGTWGVTSIPFFPVNDGGLAFLGAPSPAIYFVEGESGTRFARALDAVEFLSAAVTAGSVPAFGHQDVGIRFESGELFDGTYRAEIRIASNDPVTPVLGVPATLLVIGAPNLVIEGETVTLTSDVSYNTDGARTVHDLVTSAVGATSASIRLDAEGDYGDPVESATLLVEGTTIGSVGSTGFDCTPTHHMFTVSPLQLQAWGADGHVVAEVQNTFDVNPFCAVNRHLVTLSYQLPANAIEFGSLFTGDTRNSNVLLKNSGSVPLVVGSIVSSRPEYSPSASSFTVAPRSSRLLGLSYHPTSAGATTATITITSNDPDQPTRLLVLSGTALVAPVASLNVSSVLENLYPGGTSSRPIQVRNTGGSALDWTLAIENTAPALVESTSPVFTATGRTDTGNKQVLTAAPSAPDAAHRYSSPVSASRSDAADGRRGVVSAEGAGGAIAAATASDDSLEDVRAALDSTYFQITSHIPNRYDFFEGESGVAIGDGGNDMYDGGNFLSTNLGGPLSYTNGPIFLSTNFGSTGRYFTRKYPGLFVLVADLDQVDEFIVAGNLGADGGGSADGATYVTTVRGVTYRAFAKRVYGAGDPSVNHLIVVEDGPGLVQDFSTSTDDDYHRVRGLSGATRIYYLVYASNFGGYVDDTATRSVLSAFLDGIQVVPEWLTATPVSGTTGAGAVTNVTLGFNAVELAVGDYFAHLVLSSNDPVSGAINLPVQLHVVGRPALALGAPGLDFGTVFVGYPGSLAVVVSNPGSEQLSVSGMSSSRADFAAAPTSFTLAAHESTVVTVTFTPHAAGAQNADLVITSNDPDSPATLALAGSGLFPPHLTLDPAAVAGTVPPGGSRVKTLSICNTGASPLTFDGRLVEVRTAPAGAAVRGGGEGSGAMAARQRSANEEVGAPVATPGGGGARTDAFGGPDAFGYRWLDSDSPGGPAYSWVDIRSFGTEVPFGGAADDVTIGPFPIGFTFPFYGNTFSGFNVSSNGFLSFTSLSSRAANTLLPNVGSLVPENLVAPFWDDLAVYPAYGGKVLYHSDATRLVVQFARAARFGDVGFLDFEVILYPNGRIVYQYQSLGSTRTSATVGIQNQDRTIGLTTAYNAAYLHNGLAIEYIGAPDWVSITPRGGEIPAGGCLEVEVRFDAAQLVLGDYSADLQIVSNDPAQPALSLDLTLHVQDPMIADLKFTPRTLNGRSNGNWAKGKLTPRAPYGPEHVVISSVRLNGVLAPDLAASEPTNPDELPEGGVNLKFLRSQVAALLPGGDSVDVAVTGDYSDGGIFVAHDVVRVIHPMVTAPNGGELLNAGSSVTVRWTVPAEFESPLADLFWSPDGGAHWTVARTQLTGASASWTVPNVATTNGRVKVQLHDEHGLLGLDASDADFAVSGAVASLGDEAAIAVREVALRQNTPNPFRKGTSIGFDLPRDTKVRMRVFDMAGRTVRVLADGPWPLGRHEVAWDGRDARGNQLPPGIYLYRFEAGSYRATKRLVMLE